ncbi:uncharacterized protein LOC112906475 [Agrilus planipennis]|uniref:Uncharacterized protein LOC112906475 n=1 Tax=Agrilus planipennis TaxID=224129 RepID=A0A7F5RKA9_AGRPL|nr:uncharacterized protein LOC112906475 [Agrilus planipennis]
MGINFGWWTILKLIEVGLVIACLITKGVTDHEATKIFLYLQKLSREWSLLNNVTWDRVGAAVADATYGGFLIITIGLFLGRLFGELPTKRRITEIVLLGIGIILFVILGSLEFAALDSVPHDLVDNAAILGCFSLATAILFLIDLAGPRKKDTKESIKTESKYSQTKIGSDSYEIESEKKPVTVISQEYHDGHMSKDKPTIHGYSYTNGLSQTDLNNKVTVGGQYGLKQNGYHKLNDKPLEPKFDIYGKDKRKSTDFEKDAEVDEVISQIVKHEPVWSRIRKGKELVYL